MPLIDNFVNGVRPLKRLIDDYVSYKKEHESYCEILHCEEEHYTDNIYDFLDDYVMYDHTAILLISELLMSHTIKIEDIETAFEDGDNISMVAFLLCETYIYRYDTYHQERAKRKLEQEKEQQAKKKKRNLKYSNYLYADFVDEDDIEL